MREWSNAKHEDALHKRRIKNEERKYIYERVESTGYECYPSTSTQQSYLDNDLRPTRKVQKNKR